MMTEILLSTILTASVAGAGLLIAIYTLFAQLRTRIFERRVVLLREKNAEFERVKKNLTPESIKGTEQLKELAEDILSRKRLPAYLSYVKYVFAAYIVCVFFSLFWLTDVDYVDLSLTLGVAQYPQAELLLLLIFSGATVGFFLVVWNAVQDVHELMEEEFIQLNEEAKEASVNLSASVTVRGQADVRKA